MRFGINILNFGAGTDPSALLSWARFAEDRGFDSAMISDHVAITPDAAQFYPAPFYDPFTTLAWVAGQTERIQLGTTVAVVPYRHPLHTARVAANIDQFSGGRLILGVGLGWSTQEYAALNVDFHQRGAITDEYLDVITLAWQKKTLSYEGRFVSFEEVATGPLPAQAPPVWVGGVSAPAMRRAVHFGTAWHPYNQPLSWLRDEGMPALRRAAEVAGRPVPELAPRLPLQITEQPLDDDGTRLAGQGTLDQVRADLDGLAELGATHVLFDTYPGSPADQRPPEVDQKLLDAVASEVLGR